MLRIRYLAYGSNLHPLRLGARVPSARVIGVVSLPGRRLAFHKRSVDGSAKCLVYTTGRTADVVYGALYDLDAAEKPLLDAFEGLGKGYDEERLDVLCNGATVDAYTYAASASHIVTSLATYDWYKRLVLAGARFHRFPAEYIGMIEAVPAVPDPDDARRVRNEELLARMELR